MILSSFYHSSYQIIVIGNHHPQNCFSAHGDLLSTSCNKGGQVDCMYIIFPSTIRKLIDYLYIRVYVYTSIGASACEVCCLANA